VFYFLAANNGFDKIVEILVQYYNFYNETDDYSSALEMGKKLWIK